jgi:hypothetical protein
MTLARRLKEGLKVGCLLGWFGLTCLSCEPRSCLFHALEWIHFCSFDKNGSGFVHNNGKSVP